MEDLIAIQDEVKNKVAREEAQHQRRLKAVQVWLTRVEIIDTRVSDLISTSAVQLQKLCLCGLCSKNLCLSYKYGKRVFLLSEEIKNLKSEGHFEEVTELTPRSEVVERPTRPTIGHKLILEEAWNRIMEDGVGTMGLHGMGGVGKTTIFKKIHNKFAEMANRFDVVIWVVVSQGVHILKLQEEIAQKLHLCGDQWTNKNESDKAAEMHRVLKGKRFVLMLDDIWEKVDLEAIGVPFPTRENGCKVAFTTRSRQVCRQMGDHEPMHVKCLERDEAWELFSNKIGDSTLRRNPFIVELARKVAAKCRGLPLALNVIGETMTSKTTVQEWEHAINVLTRSAAEFPNMENKILPILKYSYDSLVNEHIKSCFLYCAMFPEDDQIEKERLIEYWICEGFLGEYQVMKSAMNKGYEVLGTLIRANLLTDEFKDAGRYLGGVGKTAVKMHDVVREMALWIASYFGNQKDAFVVNARLGLREIPKVKDWGAVRRMSLMGNNIKELTSGSTCFELTTLFLQNNNLENLSGEFMRSMKKLAVLDLSDNWSIHELPEWISELASLQYLDLSYTSIEQLPVGFHELKKLSQLNLAWTVRLCSMAGISKLTSLRILKLQSSNVHGDVSLVKELQLLEHLQVVTITISTESGLGQLLGDPRLANSINGLEIRGFQQKPVSMENHRRKLWLESFLVMETNIYTKYRESETGSSGLHNPTSRCYTNLSVLHVYNLCGIKDLTWLLFAPNLVYLQVFDSKEVEEIINNEKAANLIGITPFQNLEYLSLVRLPNLVSIYWSPLPFPFLRRIETINCPKLRKLPLDATSVPRLGWFTVEMDPREQKTELEWEDEDTQNRFLPLFS
ncbi:unnamed protein product [Thlaspi arvense]|uniref:NB-ARC domain-containing protein n=1 Tax=Thlaspi arvense TaxID=13288 RepID=A0AAU9RPF3_THLAR|nr:unnamed protein product [Thlaspi arvense]